MKTLTLILLLLLTGCAQIMVTRDGNKTTVKANAFFYEIDIDKLQTANVEIERLDSESNNVKAVAPGLIVETE